MKMSLMPLMQLLFLFATLISSVKCQLQGCNATRGPTGYRSAQPVFDVGGFQCWYIGPSHESCTGSCQSGYTFPDPHIASSLDELCECCSANIIFNIDQVLECGQYNPADGDGTWETYYWFYYSLDNCDCLSSSSSSLSWGRRKRQDSYSCYDATTCSESEGKPIDEIIEDIDIREPLLTQDDQGITVVNRCVRVKNTYFSNKCNPDGFVTICDPGRRPTVSDEVRQQFRAQMEANMRNNRSQSFYEIPEEEIIYEKYDTKRRNTELFPASLFRESENDCDNQKIKNDCDNQKIKDDSDKDEPNMKIVIMLAIIIVVLV